MDIDTAKENIQPLRQGRRADRLEAALGEHSKETLEIERKQYEDAIANYEGLDPLSAWYEYICWIEQSFTKGGTESGLDEAVLNCIVKFENDTRYRQDRRMIKLYIKYIDTQEDPNEFYSQLYSNGIGTLVADLYIAWSYYFDATNNFQQAEAVFRKGLDAKAQPFEDLTQAHQAFSISMSQRLLYKDESSLQQFRTNMDEKRSALTSLRAHKKKYVGSVRTGIVVRHENPGVVNQENFVPATNTKVEVHEDAAVAPALPIPVETSVIRSIIDSARKKENTHEPGPWTKSKSGKVGGLFGKDQVKSQLDFNIMEDENLPPIPCKEELFEKGIQLPEGFVTRNRPQTSWNIPLVVPEPVVPRAIPCYEKCLLYPNEVTEICPDEYRGFKWFKDHGMTSALTEQYENIWANTFESGIRIHPGFVRSNVKQVESLQFERFVPGDDTQGFVVPFDKVYPADSDEMSFEELLDEKFKRGEIILVNEEDFEEIDDMELTQIGDRRQSFYPTSRASFLPRKSIVVRKSIMPPPTVDEDEEEEQEEDNVKEAENIQPQPPVVQSTGAIRKSIMKRKLEDNDYKLTADDYTVIPKKDYVSETPPRSAFGAGIFKTPAPVDKKQVLFSMDEDEVTCSTQQFNFFLQAQSVSTPVAKKKYLAHAEKASDVEESAPAKEIGEASPDMDAPTVATSPNPESVPKQLSTIMETTETTQSTKSSVSQVSTENETDLHSKTPKTLQKSCFQPEQEKQLCDLAQTLKLHEEQTETCANYVLPKIQEISLPQEIKNCDIKAPATPRKNFLQNFSIVAPPSQFDVTVKSPASESSTKTEHEVTQIENKTLLAEQTSTSASKDQEEISAIKLNDENVEPIKEIIEDDLTTQPTTAVNQTQIAEESVLNIPATQEISASKDDKQICLEESVFDVPQPPTDDDPSFIEIPETQALEDNSLGEIPETQPIQDLEAQHVVKNDSIAFNIYEDSVMEQPNVQSSVQVKVPEESGTSFLHASRKENVVMPLKTRTVSDEFLDLLSSPKKSEIVRKNTDALKDVNVSDLLKFSNNSLISGSTATIEAKLENVSIAAPPRKVSSPFAFDADLNTQNFQAALGPFKNSTLLSDQFEQKGINLKNMLDNLDLSVKIEEDELIKMELKASNNEKIQEVSASQQELERLGLTLKNECAEFKIPSVPALKAIEAKPSNNFEIYVDSTDDDNDDMSKSIYRPQALSEELELDDDWEEGSFVQNAFNQYEHTVIEDEREVSLKVKDAILNSNGNPFDARLRDAMLDHCNFSLWLAENIKSCQFLGKIPALRKGARVAVDDNEFSVTKLIAKGGFGTIYSGKHCGTGEVVAMKQEKPPSLWEYYICVELRDRLKDKRMLPAFMSIDYAVIANNASILMSQFSPHGTIINVCNKHKKLSNRDVDEYVVMVLTTQLLSIMDHLHSCQIIHADVKPDNFLVMSKIELGMKTPAIQLIDFGTAIDMDWYDAGTTFSKTIKTENFVCCEMLENKPWTYQTDLFGLAGTSFAMLFGRYMEVEKNLLEWNINTRYPRYLKKFLWENFFRTLLNVPSCNEMPNLQALKDQFEEFIQENEKSVREKIADFNKILCQKD